MKRILILFLTFTLFACENSVNQKEEEIIVSKFIDTTSQKKRIIKTPSNSNYEYLDWDSLKINGKLPLECKKKDLINALGQPDSIIIPNFDDICVSYFENNFKLMYYGLSEFEVSAGMAVISSINFTSSPDIELKTNSVTLSSNTRISDLEKLFPHAVKNQSEIDVYKIGKMKCVHLGTNKEQVDSAWLLFFSNDKLIRIDFWQPC